MMRAHVGAAERAPAMVVKSARRRGGHHRALRAGPTQEEG